MRRLGALCLLLAWAPAAAGQECALGDAYCIRLEPSARTYGAEGFVRLVRPSGTPFMLDVDREGRHRFETEFVIRGLPPAAELGPYVGYVAWVASPALDEVERLGTVSNGVVRTGAVARNKYLIWVSAETDPDTRVRSGPLVLRGLSGSTRMEPHAMVGLGAFADATGIGAGGGASRVGAAGEASRVGAAGAAAGQSGDGHAGHPAAHAGHGTTEWPAPPMPDGVLMAPGMASTIPSVRPYLPAAPDAPPARPRTLVRLASGDTLRLTAGAVSRTVNGRRVVGYGFNGQIPGPLIQVDQGAHLYVDVRNDLPEPTAVHWHGLRLENAFDGVPGLTQEPIPPGGRFLYRLTFPDGGLYWYHPHHREDIGQDLGLYGNIQVLDAALPAADREEVLMLDDVLMGEAGLIPYGEEAPNFALMGRFGNVLLTNGEPRLDLRAAPGERVRLLMTNVSNTRTFNWSVDGHALEVMATDVGPYPEAVWTESVVIAPAERYVVDIVAADPGTYLIANRVQSIDHGRGRFFSSVDTLGVLVVTRGRDSGDAAAAGRERSAFDHSVQAPPTAANHLAAIAGFDDPSLAALAAAGGGEPDLQLDLTLRTEGLPAITEQMMRIDRAYFNPVEWSGTMPHMNWSSTGQEVSWILRDPGAGAENMDVSWRFQVGDRVRVRLHNDVDAAHAMQHPIHFHGQRFLVLSVNGEPNRHPAWKDTVLVPVGADVDVLLELSNPGEWMIHCHIAEHLSSGMRMVFQVDPR